MGEEGCENLSDWNWKLTQKKEQRGARSLCYLLFQSHRHRSIKLKSRRLMNKE